MLLITSLRVVLVPPYGEKAWLLYVDWNAGPQLKVLGLMDREEANLLAQAIGAIINETNQVIKAI